ncbi:MAG: HD domain-containing protein [Candidatus Bathyarchaeota archaeon]|nr:HD domain-containing protein [Candidatus Bathyarchaeota archaeon]
MLEIKVGASMRMDQHWGEIKDPVHGYVYVTKIEKDVVDSFPMQRLHRLRQLAGAEYVYPGANHTRFEHSIGTMYLAQQLVRNPNISQYISIEEAAMIRLAALVHDVGHGPFSHVFEYLLEKHLDKNHEEMTLWIIQKSELSDIIRGEGYNAEAIAKLAVGSLRQKGRTYMDQIIQSAIDVDKLDFVMRDTYHTGAKYGNVDVSRLIQMLDVLEENLAVNIGALSALESFILARIESFRSIYFHRVSRAAQIMLATAMEKAKDALGLVDYKTPEEYLSLNDYTVWTMLKLCEESRNIMENLERRRLLKCSYDKTFHLRDKTISKLFSTEEIRNEMRDQIAEKARVDPQTVVIDVPTVPSVPYHHSVLLEPMEIPIFSRTKEGERIAQRLSEISRLFEALRGFINVVRVYTEEKYRDQVAEASTRVLGELPYSARISY